MRPWFFGSACLLLSVSSLAAQKASDEVLRLVEQLGDQSDSTLHYKAYRELIRLKPPAAIPLLVKALPGYPLSSQSWGVSILSMFPTELRTPAWRKLLKCSSAYLRMSAAVSLYHEGDRSLVRHIAAAIKEAKTDQERSMILSRLWNIKEPAVQAAVRGLLVPGVGITVLDPALRQLLRAGDFEAKEAVGSLLAAGDLPAEERALCAAFLLAMGDTKRAATLAELIASGEIASLHRLAYLLGEVPHLDKKVLDAVLGLLDKAGNSTQITYALQILGQHNHRKAIPAMQALLEDKEARISKAAFEALAKMGDALKPKTLHQLLHSENPELRLAAADTLRKMDDLSGLPQVLALVEKGGSDKAEAVEVLGGFRLQASVTPLIDAMLDPDQTVRTRAQYALTAVFRSLFPYRNLDLEKTGYSSAGPEAQRTQAVEKIRSWWVKNRPLKVR